MKSKGQETLKLNYMKESFRTPRKIVHARYRVTNNIIVDSKCYYLVVICEEVGLWLGITIRTEKQLQIAAKGYKGTFFQKKRSCRYKYLVVNGERTYFCNKETSTGKGWFILRDWYDTIHLYYCTEFKAMIHE